MRGLGYGVVLALLVTAKAGAAGFLIRIGDADGFGYGSAPGFKAANGGPANVDQFGYLKDGDFLPDVNEGGRMRNEGEDEFDFRSAAEIGSSSVLVAPGVSAGISTGSEYTDISLNERFDARSKAQKILIGGNPTIGLVRGAGGPFPSPPSSTLPNQPGFVFDFLVDKSNLPDGFNPNANIFFNLLFADYDVTPAKVTITKADTSTRKVPLRTQNQEREDGLIQSATATLAFDDVFSETKTHYHGFLKVDFDAPDEPYTAFDFVELSLVPEPGTLGMLVVGMLGVGGTLWARVRIGNRAARGSN